MVRLNAKVRKR